MAKWKKLAHVVYQCSYHIVWCPKYRFRIMKGGVGKFIEETIRSICEWKSIEILELNVRDDHVHAVVNIPPKLSISEVMGILKGKTAIKLFKSYPALKSKPYWGNHFWSRGYCVSTVGLDENKIRRYVKYQEENERLEEDQRQEFGLF
ncbi:MAG: IS200/IS605 family transposase [Planctomycetes bacterium]|nr:IS200/IS605 family transposase [Planctomycetota bacterium]